MTPRFSEQQFRELAESREHILLRYGDYKNGGSIIDIGCKVCGFEWSPKGRSYIENKKPSTKEKCFHHGSRYTTSPLIDIRERTSERITLDKVLEITEPRNHEVIDISELKDQYSSMTIKCRNCKTLMIVVYKNYKKSIRWDNIEINKGDCPCLTTPLNNPLVNLAYDPSAPPHVSPYVTRGGKYQSWRRKVRKRCKFTCVISGEKKPRGLEAHHLQGYLKYEELRYDPKNGVLLTRNIHTHFHQIYGKMNVTEEMFSEFCETHYGLNWEERKKELGLN